MAMQSNSVRRSSVRAVRRPMHPEEPERPTRAGRLLSVLMLCALGMIQVSPALAELEQLPAHDSPISHHDYGAPCPDGDGEEPCDDGCPCLCCPGHTNALIAPSTPSLPGPRLATSDRIAPPDEPIADGAFDRVFRPPRT